MPELTRQGLRKTDLVGAGEGREYTAEEVVQLTGDEMMKCFEWDKFFPITAQELEESVI